MAFYYNTTNGPVAFNLADGASCVLPPRQWVAIEEAGSSPDLVRLLKRKLVLRQEKERRVMVSLPSSKPTPQDATEAGTPVVVEAAPSSAPEAVVAPVEAVAEVAVPTPVQVPVETAPEAKADEVATAETPVEKVESKQVKPFSSYRGGNFRRSPPVVNVPSSTASDKDSELSDAASEKPNS